MLSEQFIQDAICRPERLIHILELAGRSGYKFESSENGQLVDVVNQELSFSAGRIDVLATFNARSKVVLVEVKAGEAEQSALDQLMAYLARWADLQRAELGLQDLRNEDVVGILLAEAFVNIAEVPPNVILVTFSMMDGYRPFKIINVAEIERREARPLKKSSCLYSLNDHVSYIQGDYLQQKFMDVVNCFLDESDVRRDWLIHNPKSQHLAVHYKGEYVLDLWARRSSFIVGYTDHSGIRREAPVDATTPLEPLQAAIEYILGLADDKLSKDIRSFSWTTKS